MKKMNVELDIKIDKMASGFGKDGRMFSHDYIDKEIRQVKDILHGRKSN